MSRHPSSLVCHGSTTALIAATLIACNSVATVRGRDGLVARAGVGKTCEGATKSEDRPFVVNWDSTDTSLFEATAKRDSVFVHYEGCELSFVNSCRHEQYPGRFGAYGEPVFTNGANSVIEIDNEDALRAQLPLGVAAFGAQVARGESLRLRYFVSGVAQNTKGHVYATELRNVPGCEGVTHFVKGFNIGAFRLETQESTRTGVSASYANVGVSGESKSRERRLGEGGDLDACARVSKDGCRVPIRLVLQRLSTGDVPAADKAPLVSGALPSAADDFNSFSQKTNAVLDEAFRRKSAGDGKGCVLSTETEPGFDDRIARNDPHAVEYLRLKGRWMSVRALCLSSTGACEDGRKLNEDRARVMARANGLANGNETSPTDLAHAIEAARTESEKTCPQKASVLACVDQCENRGFLRCNDAARTDAAADQCRKTLVECKSACRK